MGSFPMVLVGLLFAVSWAAFWVTNLMPAKDKEGTYKTYIGGGMLPPEGYTNPLDPRVSEEYAQEDDPLYENKGSKSASSAIVRCWTHRPEMSCLGVDSALSSPRLLRTTRAFFTWCRSCLIQLVEEVQFS